MSVVTTDRAAPSGNLSFQNRDCRMMVRTVALGDINAR